MTELPASLQRARAAAHARRANSSNPHQARNGLDADSREMLALLDRTRPPTEAPPRLSMDRNAAPSPFPMRAPVQDWERARQPGFGRGSITGGGVRLPGAGGQAPPSRMVPYQEATGEPPPLPFSPAMVEDPMTPSSMRVPFAQVQDFDGASRVGGALQTSRQPSPRGFEPPSAPQEQTAYLSNEDPEWNAARGRVREQLAAEYRDNISRVPRPGNTTLNQAVAAARRGPDDKVQRKGDGPIIGGGTLIPPRQVAQDQQDFMRGTNQSAPRVDPATGWPIDPVTGQPVAPLEWDRMQRQAAEQQRQDQERASRGNQWGVSDEGVTFRRRW